MARVSPYQLVSTNNYIQAGQNWFWKGCPGEAKKYEFYQPQYLAHWLAGKRLARVIIPVTQYSKFEFLVVLVYITDGNQIPGRSNTGPVAETQ